MGGGSGANSSPPVDVAPGGGTYPTNLFGQAYSPTSPGLFGLNANQWQGIGTGISTAGKDIAASGATTPAVAGAPSSSVGSNQYPPILIPTAPMTPLGASLQSLYGIYNQLL